MRRKNKVKSFIGLIVFIFFLSLMIAYAFKDSMTKSASLTLIFMPPLCTIILIIVVDFIIKKKPKQYNINLELSRIDQLDGYSFEFWCAKLLERLGYSRVRVTKPSGDFGADILCYYLAESIVVQCKRHNKNIGIHPVQEIIGARIHYNAKQMIIMTNSFFTSAAIKLARESGVELWDRSELEKKMNIVNAMYVKEQRKKKKEKKTTTSQIIENDQNSHSRANESFQINPNPQRYKHDYQVTIMRLHDNSTYVLYRLAYDANEALSLVNRVIDINEKVIEVKDIGEFIPKTRYST